MRQNWQQWNRRVHLLLWVLTIVGVIAALPIGVTRWQMEKTSNQVEFVFDYRDLVQIASYQAHPQLYIKEQLVKMKDAGVHSMAVVESSLQDLSWAGRLTLYNSQDVSVLTDKPKPANENYTYLLFAGKDEEAALRPMIEATFKNWEIEVSPWSYKEKSGLVIQTPVQNAVLKTMSPDPIAVQTLHDAGFAIVPRFSDRTPYNQEAIDKLLTDYKKLGVSRIIFEGDAVKGYGDNPEKKSIASFAEILNRNGMGITTIENSKPQKGMNSLAYLTHYNVARLYSLSDSDAATMKPDAIVDRFQLAVKDRSIRMFYLNSAPTSSVSKSSITNSLQNLYDSLQGDNGAIAKLDKLGFTTGDAKAFDYQSPPSWQKPLKALVALGAIAFISLLVSAFVPGYLVPIFLLACIGSAGLYVLSKSMFEQGLALGAAISAPTLAIIWALGRVRAHTVGNRRPIGGAVDAGGSPGLTVGMRMIFPGISAGRRFTMAIAIFATTSLISIAGIPFVVGLLNNMTYKLVLEQFRGVSLLHLAPIALAAIYVFLYTGDSVLANIRKLLKMQITVLWVVIAVVVGVAGLYYLSRTGNAGKTSSLDLMFRSMLENTFGVRPRTKELLSHPLFFLGLFLALRYRAAWVLFIVGAIGQLSLVDTFAHIHTPLPISIIRVMLGLVIGALLGVILVGIWQVLEGVWKRWSPRFAQAKQNSKSGV
ncbi:hypothetical protein Back11_52300 [Paenibacillus baekrokdamisoli]|uniref:Uncharacterized protein n=1 Tax=Paenibacillus baekrokdamisoli TaxID=1712516 RepID=A0A3G9J6F9_9BACL|nr:DUF5693 family protein [Paenibacillus baekrokdamisoli]MBB3069067.1 hypothetical protein [Paenibacillus baekrokdamisoli]BBH23885.1 hypothetical protein Back11_52300 [Paenibacillus baekrokdamisoli]